MSGEEKLRLWKILRGDTGDVAGEEVVDDGVIGCVGLGFGVVDAVSDVVFDVGAADELDGEGPVFSMGDLKLMRELFP